jgi:hypothetical protein
MDTQRIEYLKMLQKAIERMAQNSFVLKGWSVTLASGMLALAIEKEKAGFAFLALLPAGALWGLDAFYLRQERLFRGLHDIVREGMGTNAPVTFSMDTSVVTGARRSWARTLFAKVIIGLHAPLMAVILAVAIYIHRAALAAVASCVFESFRR